MRQPNSQSFLHCNKDKALHKYVMIIESMASYSLITLATSH